jgi:2,4-dienoyl-CoA reductase-like NADH-dependent reductase (Old Yellow Enzyme family)/thioredoxin reductase
MADRKYPHLFSPLKVGPLTLKNRIEAAPISLAELSPDSYLTRENIAAYRLKAKGGAAVVTIGESIVHTPTGKSHPKQIPLDDPGVIASLTECADAIHQHGALASIELSHGGMECDPVFLGGRNPIGPSATTVDIGFREGGEHIVQVEEMSEALMLEIADAYGAAAATVKLAGFDMLMLHAAHGWLLAQFLSPLINKRTDAYGGSLENRARFPLMVLDHIRERVGRDFPIELRMGGSELAPGGYTIEDAVALAKLVEDKVDLLHVSCGAHYFIDTMTVMHPSMFLPHGCNVYLAAAVKQAVSLPVTTVGGLSDPAQMEQIIAGGQADVVAIARGLIADPDLPKKALRGDDDQIVRCLRCFECQSGMFTNAVQKCTVNPVIGREFESAFAVPPAVPRKVLVVGGGPAGMQAAITAAERGHDVTLLEKNSALGGALRHAAGVSFKDDLARFGQQLERMVQSLQVAVICDTEVTPLIVEGLEPDVVIVSVGAEPIVPPIPGVDKPAVMLAAQAHAPGAAVGDRVVVIGGGQVGSETALHLAGQGKQVTIVEMLDEIARDANIMHRRALLPELQKAVTLKPGHRAVEIADDAVVAIGPGGERVELPYDTVVIAVGYRPLTEVVDALRDTAPEVMTIGDCVKPRKVLQAIRTGYDAGMAV